MNFSGVKMAILFHVGFRCQYPNEEHDTMQVSWSLFSKESLADRSFTFWDWFYAIMKLTKEHLKPLWTDG